jgi:hypothetical protein
MIIAQVCDETYLPAQALGRNGLIGPFPPKDRYDILPKDRLSGMMESGDSEDEIDIGTTENQNCFWQ